MEGAKANIPLVAANVDNLDVAGTVDPFPALPEDQQAIVLNPSSMFLNIKEGEITVPEIDARSRLEYMRLVVRQLRCTNWV